jgi:3-keto-5-aminohexanoate cleavage enzyme
VAVTPVTPVTSPGIVVTAALTGPIASKDDHPGLPVTPQEIAQAAADAHAAGAAIVHLHVRDEQGLPTADLDIAARTLELVGDACGALVQLSTGVGLDVPFEDREALVELRPRMATLNVCSMSFGSGEFRNPSDGVRRLVHRMAELGVKPEFEIYDTGHLDVALALAGETPLEPPLQFSIVLGVRGGMAATAANLVHVASMLPPEAVWQIVAVGRTHLPLLTLAVALGANARAGLEDTLMIGPGIRAPDNATLVRRAVEVATLFGRTPLSSQEAAARLGLPDEAANR